MFQLSHYVELSAQDIPCIWDIFVTPLYFLIILVIAGQFKRKGIQHNDQYKYFVNGLVVKMFGGLFLALIYIYYYNGGDTTFYQRANIALIRLLFKNPGHLFEVLFYENTLERYFYFDDTTGFPSYYFDDATFLVSKLTFIISFFCFGSFFATTMVLAALSYAGIWKMYITFCEEIPHLKREFAISILFIPSLFFWGSGLLKDTITLSSLGWFVWSFYNIFSKRRNLLKSSVVLFISSILLIYIKPYIFFAAMPGSLIWLASLRIRRIRNEFMRIFATPILIAFGFSLAYILLLQLSDQLGFYALDNVLERAVLVQKDMKAEYYGGNAFDIGDFDPSVSGILSKAHLAIFAALFRPSLLDVKNPVMFIAAAENTFTILFTVFLLIKVKFLNIVFIVRKNPLLLFSFMFAIFFAFSVGLTTPNFGSLARLRIPLIPFFWCSLFMIRYYYVVGKKR